MKNKKKIFVIIQLIITIVLLIKAVIASGASGKTSMVFDLSKFKSDYAEYNGEEIAAVNTDGINADNAVDFGYYKLNNINCGSYTLDIEYEAAEDQHCRLSVNDDDAYFLHSSEFLLSRSKHHVSYDFNTSYLCKDFGVNFVKYTGGDFVVKNITISTNGRSARTTLFIWMIVILTADFFILGSFTREAKLTAALIIGIATAASIPLFMDGMNMGDDMEFHLARIEGIAEALSRGSIPVRMNEFFYEGYGYPVDIFYGSALLYIPAMLRIIGFTITGSYKIFVFAVNLLTAAITYYCGKNMFRRRKTAVAAAMCYTLATYRLIDVYARSAVGEYSAMIFLPLVILGMYKIYTSDSFDMKNAFVLTCGMAGLLYTHVLTTEHTAIILIITALVLFRRTFSKKIILTGIAAVVIFFIIGAAFIIPFVDYYLNTDTIIKYSSQEPLMIQSLGAYISDYFAFFRGLFGNAYNGVGGRMQLTPGLALTGVLIGSIYMMIAGKANKTIRFFTVLSVLLLFAGSNLFPWNIFAKTYPGMIMSQVQFPWRYIGIAIAPMSFLVGFTAERCEELNIRSINILKLVVLACVITTASFVSSYEESAGQTVLIDTADITSNPKNGSEYVIGGTPLNMLDRNIDTKNADASIASESGISMVLDVNAYGTSAIDIPRFAYPYYKAYDENGNEYKLSSGNMNKLRIIISEPYSGKIYVKFSEPWYWRISEMISLFGVLMILVYSFRKYKIRTKEKD